MILTCIIPPVLWHTQLCRTFQSTCIMHLRKSFCDVKITMHCKIYLTLQKKTKRKIEGKTFFKEKSALVKHLLQCYDIFMSLQNLRSFAHGNL